MFFDHGNVPCKLFRTWYYHHYIDTVTLIIRMFQGIVWKFCLQLLTLVSFMTSVHIETQIVLIFSHVCPLKFTQQKDSCIKKKKINRFGLRDLIQVFWRYAFLKCKTANLQNRFLIVGVFLTIITTLLLDYTNNNKKNISFGWIH